MQTERLTPIINKDRVPNVSFYIDNLQEGSVLKVRSTSDLPKLVYINKVPQEIFLDSLDIEIDQVATSLQSEKLLFTIVFSKPGPLSELETYLLTKGVINPVSNSLRSEIDKNDYTYFSSFLVTVLIILGFLMVFSFQSSSTEISDLGAIDRSLTPRNRDELLMKNKPFDKVGLLMLTYLVLVISLVYQIAFFLSPSSLANLNIFGIAGFWSLVANWILLASALLTLAACKYLVIRIFAALFNLQYFKYIQHYNNVRSSYWIFGVALLVFSSIFFIMRAPNVSWFENLIHLIFLFLAIRILILFLKLISEGQYRVFHLFSYFCATEILPFLLVYKFILI